MKNIPWYSKLALALIALPPIWFMIASLGTRIGLWDYKFGLGTMLFTAGPWVLGASVVGGIVALAFALRAKPRGRLSVGLAVVSMIVPLALGGWFLSLGAVAGENPIHDVATDTADPPAYSASTMAARGESGANPLNDYQRPLGEIEPWKSSPRIPEDVKIRSHAQIITTQYANLSPLPLAGASTADAVQAVAAAMEDMGFDDIRKDEAAGRVEGIATSFWFGFQDDVVARIGEQQIDFRSVSRVGQSDLGANARRIAELREKTAVQIGQR